MDEKIKIYQLHYHMQIHILGCGTMDDMSLLLRPCNNNNNPSNKDKIICAMHARG